MVLFKAVGIQTELTKFQIQFQNLFASNANQTLSVNACKVDSRPINFVPFKSNPFGKLIDNSRALVKT